MTTRKKPEPEPTDAQRVAEYLVECDEHAKYLCGIADGLEASGNEHYKAMIKRLRDTAHDLSFGALYVRHGYKEPRP